MKPCKRALRTFLEGCESLPEGSEGIPEGPEGLPEGTEGLPGEPRGGTDEVCTDKQNFFPFYKTLSAVGAAAQKGPNFDSDGPNRGSHRSRWGS